MHASLCGKTVGKFRLRWDNYKMNGRSFLKGQTYMQQHLFEHFPSEYHCNFLKDVTITLIRLTLNIRTDGNVIGDMQLRELHLLVWMSKVIRLFLQFFRTLYYIRSWPLVLGLQILDYFFIFRKLEVNLGTCHSSEIVLLAI